MCHMELISRQILTHRVINFIMGHGIIQHSPFVCLIIFVCDSQFFVLTGSGSYFTSCTCFRIVTRFFMTTTRVEDARERLSSLKQCGWVRGYVNTFQKLVMQIPDMTDGEKFWRFKEGLNVVLQKEVTKEGCKT